VDINVKAEEDHIRRRLKRCGYFLVKNRVREIRAPNYGRYWVKDWHTGSVLGTIPGGNTDWAYTLEEITRWLDGVDK
jgi:hypothetical protein